MPRLTIAAQTDPGCDPAKAVNEDAFAASQAACGTFLAVCDGMGGHDSGRVASTTAIQVLQSLIETAPPDGASARFLRSILETAGRAVHALAAPGDDEHRPGSTCVALLIGRAMPIVAHVGDSRAYRLRNGILERLTNDHSLVNDLVLAGVLSPSDAHNHPDAHRITRALGMSPHVVVDIRELADLLQNDCFLLCSDGLTDLVSDDEIAQILASSSQLDPKATCLSLIELAKKRGGHDNITVAIAQVGLVETVAAVPRELQTTECEGTGSTAIPPTVGTNPLQATVALDEPPRFVVTTPTILESALPQPVTRETQPIALHAARAAAVMPQPRSAAFPSQQEWDTPNLRHSTAPRSGARWMVFAAIVSSLVLLGLAIWAVVH
jgi:protein phosphatase